MRHFKDLRHEVRPLRPDVEYHLSPVRSLKFLDVPLNFVRTSHQRKIGWWSLEAPYRRIQPSDQSYEVSSAVHSPVATDAVTNFLLLFELRALLLDDVESLRSHVLPQEG